MSAVIVFGTNNGYRNNGYHNIPQLPDKAYFVL